MDIVRRCGTELELAGDGMIRVVEVLSRSLSIARVDFDLPFPLLHPTNIQWCRVFRTPRLACFETWTSSKDECDHCQRTHVPFVHSLQPSSSGMGQALNTYSRNTNSQKTTKRSRYNTHPQHGISHGLTHYQTVSRWIRGLVSGHPCLTERKGLLSVGIGQLHPDQSSRAKGLRCWASVSWTEALLSSFPSPVPGTRRVPAFALAAVINFSRVADMDNPFQQCLANCRWM